MSTKPDSSQIKHETGTLKDIADASKPLSDYTALRAYTGTATTVRITSTGIAGFFTRDSDVVTSDNGGTVIVDASGRRWKRVFDGAVMIDWFGAVGDGVVDDTSPLNLAADEARASGHQLVGSGEYRVTSTVDLRYALVNITGKITVDHTGIGVVLGNTQSSSSGPKQEIQEVLRTVGLDATLPTVRAIGAKGQIIAVHRCDYFQVWANTNSDVASTDTSSAYSTFHLQRCPKIELTNNLTTNGSLTQWINENTFHIGRTSTLILSGTYGHNHNQFYAGAFESSTLDFQVGASNVIHSGRFEGGATVNFASGTFSNTITQSWSSNQRSTYEDADPVVTDSGEGNLVVRLTDAYRKEIPIVTVNPQTCRVFVTGTTTPVTSLSGVKVNAYGINKFTAINSQELFSTQEFGNIRLLAGEAIRFRSSASGNFRVRFYMYDAAGVQVTGASDPGYMRGNSTTVWNASGYYAQTSDIEYALAILKAGTPVHTVWVRVFAGSSAAPFESFELALLSSYKDSLSQTRATLHQSQLPSVASSPVIGYAPNAGYKVGNTAGGWFTNTFSLKTALSAAASGGTTTITVSSSAGVLTGDVIGIELDTGATHWTTVAAGTLITLSVALPSAAAVGKPVVVNRWIAT